MATTKLSNPTPTKQIHLRPVIKVPAPKVTINPGKGEEAMAMQVAKLNAILEQMVLMNTKLMEQQTVILAKLADLKVPDVKVNVPRARNKNYYVAFDREDGETVGMRVTSSPD